MRAVQGADGALYGTTEGGGAQFEGTIFKLNPDGNGYSILYSLHSSGPDTHDPQAGLLLAGDGYFYGTGYGGASSGAGGVFRVRTDGTGYAVLHNFPTSADLSDGNSPRAVLVADKEGAFYGTTLSGGPITPAQYSRSRRRVRCLLIRKLCQMAVSSSA